MKFYTFNFEFVLEVATTRVQVPVILIFITMVDETFDVFPTCITISYAFVAVYFIAFPRRGLIIEFESEFFEELVGCSGFVKHAIFVKIIVALLTSVSLSNALFLASIACVGFLIVLKLKLMLRVATMSFPHTSSYLHQKNYIQQV